MKTRRMTVNYRLLGGFYFFINKIKNFLNIINALLGILLYFLSSFKHFSRASSESGVVTVAELNTKQLFFCLLLYFT